MRTHTSLVVLALLVGATSAMAAGGGDGLGSLISLAPGSVLYTLVTFLLLLIILWKFAWGPIVKGLESREEKIHGAIEQAQRDREEAAKLLKDYEEKLKTASAEISERINRAEADATAGSIWDEINGPNLAANILPTRSRADLILRKGADHRVEHVRLRRL